VNVLYPVGQHVEHGDDNGITLEDRGGGALEEAVVSASCRAADVALASRVAAEAYSSSWRSVMVHMWRAAVERWQPQRPSPRQPKW
jgi:hypothetical protein